MAFVLSPLIVIYSISPKRLYMLAWMGYICHLSNILELKDTNLGSIFRFKKILLKIAGICQTVWLYLLKVSGISPPLLSLGPTFSLLRDRMEEREPVRSGEAWAPTTCRAAGKCSPSHPRQKKRTGNCWALMSLTLGSTIHTLPCYKAVSARQPKGSFLCVRSCQSARNH